MMRYRWYLLRLPMSLEKATQELSEISFTNEAPFGFSRLGREKAGTFRFLWRTQVVVARLDNEGTPSFEPVASVNYTDFEIFISENSVILRVDNPGRSCRQLLNALEEVFGYGFFSDQITFEDIRYESILGDFSEARLIGLKVVGAVPNKGLLARIDLVSKEGMIEREISILQKLSYKSEQAVFEVVFHGIRGQVAIASSGLVRTTGQLAPMLVDLVQRALPKLIDTRKG